MTNALAPAATHPTQVAGTIHLLPGQYRASVTGDTLVTVLGSCVAACLWDPQARVAGMNHFMLPGEKYSGSVHEDGKFGVHSMELLITALQQLGAQRSRLEAKVFGGGAVLSSVASAHVGERNAEFVLEYLSRERIPVVAQDLLGRHARKIVYETFSNRVHVKHVKSTIHAAAAEAEMIARPKPAYGTVDLF